jgi:hypothetical protein
LAEVYALKFHHRNWNRKKMLEEGNEASKSLEAKVQTGNGLLWKEKRVAIKVT